MSHCDVRWWMLHAEEGKENICWTQTNKCAPLAKSTFCCCRHLKAICFSFSTVLILLTAASSTQRSWNKNVKPNFKSSAEGLIRTKKEKEKKRSMRYGCKILPRNSEWKKSLPSIIQFVLPLQKREKSKSVTGNLFDAVKIADWLPGMNSLSVQCLEFLYV